jgi:hypothetical protein
VADDEQKPDEELLRRAYDAPENVFYHPKSGVLAVAGSHEVGDLLADDVILALGMRLGGHNASIHTTQRYREARAAYLRYRPRTVIGHSLGASVAQGLSDEFGVPARLYGAPTLGTATGTRSFRHSGVPIFLLSGAASSGSSWNPLKAHAFTGY